MPKHPTKIIINDLKQDIWGRVILTYNTRYIFSLNPLTLLSKKTVQIALLIHLHSICVLMLSTESVVCNRSVLYFSGFVNLYTFFFLVNAKINLCIIREAVLTWENIEWKNNLNPPEINNSMKIGEVLLIPVFFPNQWTINFLLEVHGFGEGQKSDLSVYRRYHPTVSEMRAEEQQFPCVNQDEPRGRTEEQLRIWHLSMTGI